MAIYQECHFRLLLFRNRIKNFLNAHEYRAYRTHQVANMCVSSVTHVFLPEYFAVRRVQAKLRIFSQTYFCRGVRFFFTAGKWSLVQVFTIFNILKRPQFERHFKNYSSSFCVSAERFALVTRSQTSTLASYFVRLSRMRKFYRWLHQRFRVSRKQSHYSRNNTTHYFRIGYTR